jgi:predicted nucleotidyltransferase
MEPEATLIDLIGLEQDLAELLGRHVDVVTEDAVSPLLREHPASSAVRI